MSYVEAQPLSGRARRRRVMRRRFLRRPAAVGSLVIVVLFVLAAVFARWVAPHPPGATDFDAILASPSREHLLGTDELGRDTLSRIIWGARASIQAGFFATMLAMAVAVPIGLVAGYYRGRVDTVIARITDVLLAFPFLILAVGLAAILGPSLLNATLALGIAAVPPLIRISRGEALELREEDYVRAAVANGANDPVILGRHILPNITSTLIVQATLTIPAAIIGEAVLSFLGLGVQPPTPSWGVMLNAAQPYLNEAPQLASYPGLAIVICALAFNLLGDGLRDVLAVDRVSRSLAPAQVLGVVGESGCGKSVTAMSMLSLLPETARVSGSVRFRGTELLGASKAQLRQIRGREISFVFQEPMTSLNPVLRIGHQIGEVLREHLGLTRTAARARTIELLDLVHIPDPERRVDEYPHQLSGGMRQRVMIAMALACDPKILIADEPTTALDVTIQAGILDLLRELRGRLGTAILLITHNLGVVADIADRVGVMYAGRKVEEAPVNELFAEPQHPYTIGLLGAIPRAGHAHNGRLREIPGRVPSLSEPPGYCAFADRCPRADELTRSEVPELRQVRPDHAVACFHPGRR